MLQNIKFDHAMNKYYHNQQPGWPISNFGCIACAENYCQQAFILRIVENFNAMTRKISLKIRLGSAG